MKIQLNPNKVIIAGENSFLGLSQDKGKTRTHWASHWRVFWSEAGSGHVLLLDSEWFKTPHVYTDNSELAHFLQKNVEIFLHPPFGNTKIPITLATFERTGNPHLPTSELMRWEGGFAKLTWSNFMAPFSFSVSPGYKGRPLGHHTTFFPASAAILQINENFALGSPWQDERGGQSCTSACLAWCETWYQPGE